jgi:hypothetical protein
MYGDVSEKKVPHEMVVLFINFFKNFVTPNLTNFRFLSDACTGPKVEVLLHISDVL